MQHAKGVAPAMMAVASYFFLSIAPAHASLSTDVMALSQRCAPSVHPATMAYIVSHESANNPYAIGINDGKRLSVQPSDKDAAIAIAERLLADGRSFDSGYGQVHSGNLPGLGLSIADLFDPCANLSAAAVILEGCFQRADNGHSNSAGSLRSDQQALRAALSCYNTNSMTRGFDNGYVDKVTQQLAYNVPELRPYGENELSQPVRLHAAPSVAPSTPVEQPGGDVFDTSRGGAFSVDKEKSQVSSPSDDIKSASSFYEAVQVTPGSD